MQILSTKMAALIPISRSFSSEFQLNQEGFSINSNKKNTSLFPSIDTASRTKMIRRLSLSSEDDHRKRFNQCFRDRKSDYSSQNEGLNPEVCEFKFGSEEKHRNSLEIYLEKVQNGAKQVSEDSESGVYSKMEYEQSELLAKNELGVLEKYLNALEEDAKSQEIFASTSARNEPQKSEESVITQQQSMNKKGYKRSNIYARKPSSFPMYDEKESGYLYLISTLLSINIAVFLFEIASPVKSSDYNLYTLPLMYGAKVNDLIMVGEWWRLVTPMFLHTGLLHIGLSSWVLLTFGPQVCKGYGSFTFLLIFILGGISGNFSSFLHTSELTVGGTGPVFALIGAWLVYQSQNKDVLAKELIDSMFQKAMVATSLSFLIGNFGPMDNLTNLGAAISGIIYGFFTCPMVQVDDASSSNLQERNSRIKDEITLNRTQAANPCKSLLIFTLFLSALTSLLVFAESPLEDLEIEELVRIIE